jgi:hypothetical protein
MLDVNLNRVDVLKNYPKSIEIYMRGIKDKVEKEKEAAYIILKE